MGKITSYPQDTTPTVDDQVLTVDIGTGSNRKVTLSDLITLFFNNQPTAAATSTTLAQDTMFDFVKGNTGIITADSVGVTRNASISAITAYQNGQKLTISAVSARSFTASKDTYVDILNTAGVGTLVYTEVTNNAAAPALAANSIRLGIVVTGATTIATTGSINQGQEDRVLPIASSIPYAVTESLGNLICPRDPNRKTLGYRQLVADVTTTSATAVQITGLSCPIIQPIAGRKVQLSLVLSAAFTSGANNVSTHIYDGAVPAGTLINESSTGTAAAVPFSLVNSISTTPAATSKTYNAGFKINGASTFHVLSTATTIAYIKAEQG